jgi:hypothetical protein
LLAYFLGLLPRFLLLLSLIWSEGAEEEEARRIL